MKPTLILTLACAALSIAACSPSEQTEVDTAATLPEGANADGTVIEPSVGAVVNEGGGVPGAASGNPAAAPSVSTPPDNAQEAQQIPQRAPDA